MGERSVIVQRACRGCGGWIRTTVRGGNTRCSGCGRSVWVPRDAGWQGPADAAADHPALTREPAAMRCRRCGRRWRSRAADQTTVRCPGCGHAVRVPTRERQAVTEPARPATPPGQYAAPVVRSERVAEVLAARGARLARWAAIRAEVGQAYGQGRPARQAATRAAGGVPAGQCQAAGCPLAYTRTLPGGRRVCTGHARAAGH